MKIIQNGLEGSPNLQKSLKKKPRGTLGVACAVVGFRNAKKCFCMKRVPKTTANPSINVTKLRNSDPKSTTNLHKIINNSFGSDSGKRLVTGLAMSGNRGTWVVYAGDRPTWKSLVDDFGIFAKEWYGQLLVDSTG